MKMKWIVGLGLAAALVAAPALAQRTAPSLVSSYENLADIILAARQMETNLVESVLDSHFRGAQRAFQAGDYSRASAEMALFANEGDNAIGGVRKRLLEGGHHHHSTGEKKGVYEPGYVLVTRAAKQAALAASAALQRAGTDGARQAAWDDFEKVAREALGRK